MSGSYGKFGPRFYMKKEVLNILDQNEGRRMMRSTLAGLQRVVSCFRMDSRRTITAILTFLLAAPFLPVFGARIPSARAEAPGASLTGKIIDQGVDADGDGLFESLVIGVETNITEPGLYSVDAGGLRDSQHNYVDVWDHTETYLDAGLVHLNLSLAGVRIYICGFNPSHVMSIDLRDERWNTIGSLRDIPLSREYSYSEFEPPKASLTGSIYDQGVDTDEDGTYDYLEIGVEVNVSKPGDYMVEVQGLLHRNYEHIDVRDSQSAYLDIGVQVVHLSLDGPTIYASSLNPTEVSFMSLYGEGYGPIGELHEIPLSRTYDYTEFDVPGAVLTGVIIDRGVDTDGDSLFEYLEIGVEINVTEAGFYPIEARGLRDPYHKYIDVWNYTEASLDSGSAYLYFSFAGLKIYMSGFNPSHILSIELRDKEWRIIGSLSDIPLSREYSYSEFETPKASLTGVIYDEAVDTDEDGTYDFLEIGVEIDVSEAGDYMVEVQGLLDRNYGHIAVGDSQSAYLNVGVQVVHLSLDGPTIYASGLNPTTVSYISLYDEYHQLFGKLHETPLSRTYFCNEFDVPVPLTVGVEVGDWAKYSLAVTWQPTDPSASEPSDIEELKRTERMEVEVQSVSNTYITIVGTYHFRDGTNKTFASMSADIAEQFLTFLIPSNLSKGDLIPGIGAIDDTVLRSYAGASRNVNYINSSTYFSGTATTRSWSVMYWDKPTGILCELLMEASTHTDYRSILLNMTETSLWEKIRTALSCSFSKDTITQGGSIAVSGSINATLSGKTVTLTYKMPDGSILTRTVTTGSDGSYSDSYAPYAIGSWGVTASWEGDSTHFGATSSLKSFVVSPKPFIETPTGIAAIAGGIAAILIAAIFILKKRMI